MYSLIDGLILAAAATATEDHGESGGLAGTASRIADSFGFDTQLFFSQLISFAIVAFLLQRFAFKPLTRVLEERRRMIAEANENSEKVRQMLAEAEDRYKAILDTARADAQRLVDEAKESGASLAERARQTSVAEAEAILARAREATEREHDRMLAELRAEMGRLVVETASKVTGKVLNPEDQKRLAEEAVRSAAA